MTLLDDNGEVFLFGFLGHFCPNDWIKKVLLGIRITIWWQIPAAQFTSLCGCRPVLAAGTIFNCFDNTKTVEIDPKDQPKAQSVHILEVFVLGPCNLAAIQIKLNYESYNYN